MPDTLTEKHCDGCRGTFHANGETVECLGLGLDLDTLTAALRDAQSALRDAAEWIEAEVEHPRSDPHPAMRRQAEVLRAILGEPRDA